MAVAPVPAVAPVLAPLAATVMAFAAFVAAILARGAAFGGSDLGAGLGGGGGVLFGIVAAGVRLDPLRLAAGVYRDGAARLSSETKVRYYAEGKTASVSVIENCASLPRM